MMGQYLGAGAGITKALWHLENVNDASGNSETLTNTGTVTFTAARFANGANLGTSNSTKYLSVASSLGITTGAITIVTWVKLTTEIASGIYTIVDKRTATGDVAYQVRYNYNSGTRQLEFNRVKNGVATQGPTYDVTLGTTNWYNIIMTYDTSNVRGYIAGVLVAGPTAASGNGTAPLTNDTSIGATVGGSNFASAIIDETIVENVAWSATKIQKYYTYALGRFGVKTR